MARQPDSYLSPDGTLARFVDDGIRGVTANPTQRPLGASTSTKDPAYADTLYVDDLEDHSTIVRTIDRDVDRDVDDAAAVLDRLARVGVDMGDVGLTLEDQGLASFHESFAHVLHTLNTKACQLARR